MGKKDVALIRYFQDERRYIDLLNAFLFQGRQVMKPEDVQELDSTMNGFAKQGEGRIPIQKHRDLMRKIVCGIQVALIGIEHQDQIHYAMPVRGMLQDAVMYDQQVQQIRRIHKERRDLEGAEYIGGFASLDRLYPVATIVLYYGKKPWDGPRRLHEMLEMDTLPDGFKKIVNDFSIAVLEVRSFEHIEWFRTDLHEVFGFIQRADDKDKAQKFIEENREQFMQMEEDAYDVIAELTSAGNLKKLRDKYKTEGGRLDMCKAIDDMVRDGRREGKREGKREGIQRGERQKARKVAWNMFQRGATPEDTAAICEEKLELVETWYRQWDGQSA